MSVTASSPAVSASSPGYLPVGAGFWRVHRTVPHGRWVSDPESYAQAVATYAEVIGLDLAAPMGWTCEPFMIERTGLSVSEHQHRTVASCLHLRELAPTLPFIPVLQGWHLADYLLWTIGRLPQAELASRVAA